MALNKRGDVLLALATTQRLVYAAHHNKIFIFTLGYRTSVPAEVLVALKTLYLARGITATAMELIHYDSRLVVTCSNGSVVIFDMSEQPEVAKSEVVATTSSAVAGTIIAVTSMVQQAAQAQSPTLRGVVLAAGQQATAKQQHEYATSASSLMPWHEVIKLKESAMRDWLRGKGEVGINIQTRCGLILAIAEKERKSLADIVAAIRPRNPYADVLFSCRLSSMKEKVPFPIVNSIGILEGHQCIFMGGHDGRISRYSLLDFYPPFFGKDDEDSKKWDGTFAAQLLPIATTTKTTKTDKYQM